MSRQGQTRAGFVICLIVIVLLMLLNLRCNTVQKFVNKVADLQNEKTAALVVENEPAYNKDLQNLRKSGLTFTLGDTDLSKLQATELLLAIHSYLDNTVILCRRKFRMGNMEDGGWEICDDPDVRPRPPCIIYSFGINNDFSFDDDASRVYGCHVYSFDPSMAKFADRVERSKLVHFYKIGLSDNSTTASNQWKMKTLADIRTMLGHNNVTIDIIKMDIEASEWSALPEMIKSGQLKTVRQLMVEYHISNSLQGFLLSSLQTLQALEQAGFQRYNVHKNQACLIHVPGYPIARTACYEVHYIRR